MLLKSSLIVTLMMLLGACSISEIDKAIDGKSTDSALCEGLSEPMDTFVNTLLEYQQKTPAPVINQGTRVVKGFDSVCS